MFLLAGCSTFGFQGKLYEDYAAKDLDYKENKGRLQIIIEEIREMKIGDDRIIEDDCISASPSDSDACLWGRNLIIADMVSASNKVCTDHMKTIFGNEASFNIFTGTLTNAFSGAATVAGGELTKSILSAIAFFSNAERSLVNESVYKSILIHAVTQKIREAREAKFRSIKQNIDSKDIKEYPVTTAIFDVLNYHESCAFMFGLEKALIEGTQDTTHADIGILTQKLSLIQLQLDEREKTVISAGGTIASDNSYIKLQERYDAVSDKLKALEIKTSSSP